MGFEIEGVLLGHAQDERALTGVSVFIFPQGAAAGCEVRGGAPATRETALLDPLKMVERVTAIVVAGGSAFGLAAADGVMTFLEEKGWGFDTGVAVVPIVPGAAVFDLPLGDPKVRPDAAMGRAACEAAVPDLSPAGNVGAGTGATVGKVTGDALCVKSGWGFASFQGAGGLKMAACVTVNALGDVVGEDGRIIAGARLPEGGFLDTERFLQDSLGGSGAVPGPAFTNTTVGVIVTNARLDKIGANWVAHTGHNGYARAIRPSHTRVDGDTIFAAAFGEVEASADLVGMVGARLMAAAVRSAVLEAKGAGGAPAVCDL
jgi:L-aminopeptidase/D-esterase-like protein